MLFFWKNFKNTMCDFIQKIKEYLNEENNCNSGESFSKNTFLDDYNNITMLDFFQI